MRGAYRLTLRSLRHQPQEKVAQQILGQVAVPEAAPSGRRGFRLRKRG